MNSHDTNKSTNHALKNISKSYSRSFLANDLIRNALHSVNLSQIRSMLGSQQFDVIDFFSGCGGMSYGFDAIGKKTKLFRHVAAFDIDKHANATFEKNFGHRPYNIDLSISPPSLIKKLIVKNQKGLINPLIVIGCAPCQGFSKHRKKDPTSQKDPRNRLISKFADIAIRLNPTLIIMENVPEILSDKYVTHYDAFKNKLELNGYVVASSVINMADYGVPQKRQRALVIASKLFNPTIPEPIFEKEDYRTVSDAIGNLPALRVGEISSLDAMHQTSKHRKETIDILKKVPKNGGSRPKGVGPACLDKVKGFYDVYGRLSWNRPSITITARCRTPSCGRYTHPAQNRGLSVREAALLQGFPTDFYIEGPFDDKFKQIGNAVPPTFALYLATHTLLMIANHKAVNNTGKNDKALKNARNLVYVVAG